MPRGGLRGIQGVLKLYQRAGFCGSVVDQKSSLFTRCRGLPAPGVPQLARVFLPDPQIYAIQMVNLMLEDAS
jgi:hypothetical protein